jgi:hypothetical protein
MKKKSTPSEIILSDMFLVNILFISQFKPTYDCLTKYWINILIYIENVVVKILIIIELLMKHHVRS